MNTGCDYLAGAGIIAAAIALALLFLWHLRILSDSLGFVVTTIPIHCLLTMLSGICFDNESDLFASQFFHDDQCLILSLDHLILHEISNNTVIETYRLNDQ
jgi:hypothetical protein